jgi:hypothetical protein
MRSPTDEFGDLRVLSVLAEDRVGIRKLYFSQAQAFGF